MPFGDGTGPMGMGPMTGRAAGYCAGYGVPGYMNPGFGRGSGRGYFGRGRGGGRGWRRWPWAFGYPGWGYPVGPAVYGPAPTAPTTEQELSALRQQAEYMQGTLQEINERIKELEAEKQR
jgi:hypothetical protein